MKSILNNPWVVASLAVGAISICGWNIVRPLVAGTDQMSDETVVDSAVAGVGEAAASIGDLGRVVGWSADNAKDLNESLRDLGFNSNWLRDPFRFTEPVSTNPEAVVQRNSNETVEPLVLASPTAISAVVVGQGFQIAVVDGKVVRRGERVEAGTIGAISPLGVEVVAADETPQVIAIPRVR